MFSFLLRKQRLMGVLLVLVLVACNQPLEREKGGVDITTLGAIPNDGKDDTVAIERALNVSGEITMPKGIYQVEGLVRVGKKSIIHGNGATFRSSLDTSNGGRTSKNIMTLSGDLIEIDDLTLDGAYSNGDAKAGGLVASLLHIYDSNKVVLRGVKSINHASNWWEKFDYAQLNDDHQKDMFSVIYIAFSHDITIEAMEQLGNIKTEGLLIYESDHVRIHGFLSEHSPEIWSSLSILASEDIEMDEVTASDGLPNQSGSSINFVANHHFLIKNTTTTTKQGFDISNEIKVKDATLRIGRDTSFGRFEHCYFKGQRALHAYPTIGRMEDIVFYDTTFIPTKAGYETWGARIEKAGKIRFEGCTFGSKAWKTYGIIMGESQQVTVKDCTFINPSIGVYLYGKHFKEVWIEENLFEGEAYTPVGFNWKGGGVVDRLIFRRNRLRGEVKGENPLKIMGNFKIKKNIKE